MVKNNKFLVANMNEKMKEFWVIINPISVTKVIFRVHLNNNHRDRN